MLAEEVQGTALENVFFFVALAAFLYFAVVRRFLKKREGRNSLGDITGTPWDNIGKGKK